MTLFFKKPNKSSVCFISNPDTVRKLIKEGWNFSRGNTGVFNFKTWTSLTFWELAATVISQQPSGIVVHYVPPEVAALKALYIFCPLKGDGRGPFPTFILVEKNSGRYLTMFFSPRWLIFVENGATDFVNWIKVPLLVLLQTAGAPAPLASEKEQMTNFSDPNHLKGKNLLCQSLAKGKN